MLKLILLRLSESYFRHRWLNLLPIVVLSALGAYYVLNAKPTYISQGVVYVQNQSLLSSLNAVVDSGAAWWITPAEATHNEISELLQTDAFIRAVIQQTNLEDEMDAGNTAVGSVIGEVRESLWVSPLGENQLLVASAHEEPEIAYQLVDAAIEGYIQWQINAQRAESESAQEFFGEVIETYSNDLGAAREELKRYLLTHPEPLRGERPMLEQVEIDRLRGTISLAESRYASALDKEENSRLAMAQIESDARQTYLVIDAPRLPDNPQTSKKDMAISGAIFVIAGVMLSMGLIVGGALVDRTFRFPVDVEHVVELPVLSVLPDTNPRLPWWKRLFSRSKSADTEEEPERSTYTTPSTSAPTATPPTGEVVS